MSVVTLRSERRRAAAQSVVFQGLERSDGAAEIGFVRRGDKTALAHLFQRAPCRVLFPCPAAGDLPLAVLLTTSGGLTGGDRLKVTVGAGAGTAAVVTGQAAEKIYRSLGPDAEIEIALSVGSGAWLEFLPQETILFEGARLVRRSSVDIATDGRLLASEMVVFGRTAGGERLTRGLLHDAWRVTCGGRLAWVDAVRLDGAIADRLNAALAFADATALATALYVGADAAALLPLARALTLDSDCRAGATLVNGVLLARFLGPEAQIIRRDLGQYLGHLRRAAAGLPGSVPRLWQC